MQHNIKRLSIAAVSFLFSPKLFEPKIAFERSPLDICGKFNSKDMITTTISNFEKEMNTYLDKITLHSETLTVNLGEKDWVVIMSLDEYNSILATKHELSSKKNATRLDASIEKIESGKLLRKNLIT